MVHNLLRPLDPTTGPAAAGRARGSGLSFLEEEVHHEILAGAEYAAQEEAEAEMEAEAQAEAQAEVGNPP